MLTAVLAVAAFLAGVTGSWSPCGFSMVTTLGPTGHEGGRRLTLAALAAFAPGALLGGVVTFAGLAALGSLLGGSAWALGAAAVVAGAGALLELAGAPIAPQVRRQVPEHWRRVLPLPVAAGLYGVLLGLGFTTFVLTFAVPALAAVALAVGDVGTGLAVGLAFGAGRLLPIALLAPVADAPLGWRATELMAERPLLLRGFRAADALALGAAALVLGAASAEAAPRVVAAGATDPSVAGDTVVWRDLAAGAASFGGTPFPGVTRAAVGGPHSAALLTGEEVLVARRADGAEVRRLRVPGADALAVSARWLVVRAGTRLRAVRLDRARARLRTVARSGGLGRPALDGDLLVHHVTRAAESRIVQVDLRGGARRVLRRSARAQLTQPAIRGDRLLLVETSATGQRLRLGRRRPETGRLDRTLLSLRPAIRPDRGAEPGGNGGHGVTSPARPVATQPAGRVATLWTTALAADAAYVTRLVARRGRTTAELLRVPIRD